MNTIGTNEYSTTTGWRVGAGLTLALVLTAAGSVAAADLAVYGARADSGAGQFGIQLVNPGAQRLDDLRFHVPDGYDVQCAAVTAQGRGFAVGGNLQAGDRVGCDVSVPLVAAGRSTVLAVSARGEDGRASVRYIGSSVRGAATLDQGFVVLAAGAVHVDDDGDGRLDAGERIDYHYTVVNVGNLPLSGLAVTDIGGAVSCPLTDLAAGANMVCTSAYTISGVDAGAGGVVNEIEVTGNDSLARPVQASDLVVRLDLQGRAGIRVFKSPLLLEDADANGVPGPGDVLGYRFVAKNDNAEDLSAVTLLEPDPGLIDGSIDCDATSFAGAAFAGNGGGALASMDGVLCTAEYTISDLDGDAGQVANLVDASAEAPIGGAVAATGASLVLLPVLPTLAVTKTVNAGSATAGGTVIYTVRVANAGSVVATDVTISDPLPAGIASFAWTCTGSGGATCPNASGNGAIMELVSSIPVGGELVYTISATLDANPPATIVNVVQVSAPADTVCLPDNAPPPCDAGVSVAVVGGEPVAAPVNSYWMLLLMVMLLGGMAVGRRRMH